MINSPKNIYFKEENSNTKLSKPNILDSLKYIKLNLSNEHDKLLPQRL